MYQYPEEENFVFQREKRERKKSREKENKRSIKFLYCSLAFPSLIKQLFLLLGHFWDSVAIKVIHTWTGERDFKWVSTEQYFFNPTLKFFFQNSDKAMSGRSTKRQ